MATEVFINVKDLPELTEIANGTYIIVETSTGTSIIDFQNFIIPTANTVLTTTVDENTNGLISLSSQTTANTTDILTLSSSIASNTYIGKLRITVPAGSRQASAPFTGAPSNLDTTDIIVTPANAYAARFPAYVSSYDNSTGNVTIVGSYVGYTVNNSIISISDIPAESNAIYNLIALKKQ